MQARETCQKQAGAASLPALLAATCRLSRRAARPIGPNRRRLRAARWRAGRPAAVSRLSHGRCDACSAQRRPVTGQDRKAAASAREDVTLWRRRDDVTGPQAVRRQRGVFRRFNREASRGLRLRSTRSQERLRKEEQHETRNGSASSASRPTLTRRDRPTAAKERERVKLKPASVCSVSPGWLPAPCPGPVAVPGRQTRRASNRMLAAGGGSRRRRARSTPKAQLAQGAQSPEPRHPGASTPGRRETAKFWNS